MKGPFLRAPRAESSHRVAIKCSGEGGEGRFGYQKVGRGSCVNQQENEVQKRKRGGVTSERVTRQRGYVGPREGVLLKARVEMKGGKSLHK